MLFDTVDTAHDVIRIATGVMSTLKLRPEKMLASKCARLGSVGQYAPFVLLRSTGFYWLMSADLAVDLHVFGLQTVFGPFWTVCASKSAREDNGNEFVGSLLSFVEI